tara:strand:- start:306 stop:497 length:192 start_codon:yes stop_codon:yes gene_type:complete
MKVGDLVQERESGEVGIIIGGPINKLIDGPSIMILFNVLWINGEEELEDVEFLKVINENRGSG